MRVSLFLLFLVLLACQTVYAEMEQVGAFSLKENAETLLQELRREGREAEIREGTTSENQAIFRVFATKPKPPKPEPKKEKPVPSVPAPPAKAEAPAPKTANLRVVFIATEGEALGILDAVKGGRPLALMAKERSLDAVTAEDYGYLGEVNIQSLDEPLRTAVSALKEGALTGPVRLAEGIYAVAQIVDMSRWRAGEAAFERGDYKSAETELKEHVRLNPDALKSYLMLGKIYESQNRAAEAEGVYLAAKKYRPDEEDPYVWLGRLYIKSRRYEDAAGVFAEGLKYDPYSERLHDGLELVEILMMSSEGVVP